MDSIGRKSNITAVGDILSGRMQSVQTAGDTKSCELGRINADMSLSVGSLKSAIPRGDYMISLHLQGLSGAELQTYSATHTHSGGEHSQTGGNGAHTHSGGEHIHVLPETLRGLMAGDRVLVAWAGNEPVVVDVLVSS